MLSKKNFLIKLYIYTFAHRDKGRGNSVARYVVYAPLKDHKIWEHKTQIKKG
jgi:hypothetical protein